MIRPTTLALLACTLQIGAFASIPDTTTPCPPITALPVTETPCPPTLTPKPVTDEPTTTKPVTEEPTTPCPPTLTPKPVTDEPTTTKPVTDEPTTTKPVTDEPTTTKPVTDEPTTTKPVTDEPTTTKPVTTEPTTTKPVTAEPTTANPITDEPTTTKPVTAEPTTSVPSTPTPGKDVRFCSYTRHALSEYEGNLYSDVIRNNLNEQFAYDEDKHRIVSKSNGKCLDVYLNNQNQYKLHTYQCIDGEKNQKWAFNKERNAIQHLTHTGICLASNAEQGGQQAYVEPCNGGLNQYFTSCDDTSKVSVQFKTCYQNTILSEGWTGLFSNAERKNINELFEYYGETQQIKAMANGECLDAFKDGNKFGLHTYPCDANNKNQKWVLAGDRVKHAVHTNLCLDSDPTDDHHAAQVWECTNYNKNQCWNIKRFY